MQFCRKTKIPLLLAQCCLLWCISGPRAKQVSLWSISWNKPKKLLNRIRSALFRQQFHQRQWCCISITLQRRWWMKNIKMHSIWKSHIISDSVIYAQTYRHTPGKALTFDVQLFQINISDLLNTQTIVQKVSAVLFTKQVFQLFWYKN